MKTTSTYGEVWSEYSSEELDSLAKVKRFLERWSADAKFREALETTDDSKSLAETYGLEIDPSDLGDLFEGCDGRFIAGGDSAPGQTPTPGVTDDLEADSPCSLPENLPELAKLWVRYSQRLIGFRTTVRDLGNSEEDNPAFHAWRQRQMRRLESECGTHADAIVHPIAAFELSSGCSVGCWFCGISAERFQGHWPYTPENAATWGQVLGHLKEEMGSSVKTGFLYWATDPLDNPDYPEFLDDFRQSTGFLPQTTTALALRDLDLTRRMLALFEKQPMVTNRFSVLSLKQLERIHATFTPREMLGVELVLQMKGSRFEKSPAGRVRERREKRGEAPTDNATLESSTIACVSGFLINMVEGTARLVSPCRPTRRWKDGYKVWEERRFESSEEFHAAIRGLIANHMAPRPSVDLPLRFRWDLAHERTEDGFNLTASTRVHRLRGKGLVQEVGDLIASGEHTYRSLRRHLLSNGTDPFALEVLLEKLFDSGLLPEAMDFDADGNLDEPPDSSILPVVNGPENTAPGIPADAVAQTRPASSAEAAAP